MQTREDVEPHRRRTGRHHAVADDGGVWSQSVLVFDRLRAAARRVVGDKGLVAMMKARQESRAREQALARVQAENARLREEAAAVARGCCDASRNWPGGSWASSSPAKRSSRQGRHAGRRATVRSARLYDRRVRVLQLGEFFGRLRWSDRLALSSHDAGWSSPVARWAHNPKVAGSNPAPATITTCSERSPVSGDLFAFWAAPSIAARFPFSSI